MRRSKLKNSQLLELQSTLQDEIQLRHQITSELTEERQNSQRLEMEVIELRQKLSEMVVHEDEHASSGGARSNSPVQSFSSSLDVNSKAPQILPINDPSYTGSRLYR